MCGEPDTAAAIMNTVDPVAQHRLGRKVNIDPQRWTKDTAKMIMESAVQAKFEQHDDLKRHLVSTDGKLLVECNCF